METTLQNNAYLLSAKFMPISLLHLFLPKWINIYIFHMVVFSWILFQITRVEMQHINDYSSTPCQGNTLNKIQKIEVAQIKSCQNSKLTYIWQTQTTSSSKLYPNMKKKLTNKIREMLGNFMSRCSLNSKRLGNTAHHRKCQWVAICSKVLNCFEKSEIHLKRVNKV